MERGAVIGPRPSKATTTSIRVILPVLIGAAGVGMTHHVVRHIASGNFDIAHGRRRR